MEAYARNHKIPMLKAEKGVSKEKCVLPHLQRMERRNQQGVYCIFTSMEMGSTFQSRMPKFPTDDPDYRILRRVPARYRHYYCYIRDPVVGPLVMGSGTYLPFQTTDRFAAFEAQSLNVHVDFPLFQRIALHIGGAPAVELGAAVKQISQIGRARN